MTNEELIQEIKSGANVQDNLHLLYTQNLPLIKQWSRSYIEREYEDKETAEHSAELWGLIDTVLDKRKADVITYRFKHGEAFKQIGERLNISVERVRQLESRALSKLRYDGAVKQWALDYYNICFTYGFNTWKNNQGSAVEIALEIAEREERRRQARLDALNARVEAGYTRARFRRYTENNTH